MPTQDFLSELFLPSLKAAQQPILHLALYRAFQQAIVQGKLAPGVKLPASRPLSQSLGVARNTVKTAYDMLQAEGYLETRHGAGSFVSAQLPEQVLQSAATALPAQQQAQGVRLSELAQTLQTVRYPPQVPSGALLSIAEPCMTHYPWEAWQRSVAVAARRLRTHEMASPLGNPELRARIADYLQVARGVHCEAGRIMICSGSQQAMYLALRLLLNPGEYILVEDPGYSGVDGALAAVGGHKIAVAADADGFRLEDGLAQAPEARMALVTPSRNFPLGHTLSLERRLALIHWAREQGAWLLEDDYDSEFRFDGSPLTALQGLGGEDCVIYAGTFSRILQHSLRLGYLVLPDALVEPFARARRYLDGGLSQLPQQALAEFMASGAFAGHVRRMRKLYAQRRSILQGLVAEQLGDWLTPVGSDGSMHVVYLLRQGLGDQAICQAALQQGLGIRPLSLYYAGTPPQQGAGDRVCGL
ncbi:MAG: PLP-dependent aminotransferase family protein [Thiolinea sp.]